MRSAVTVVRPAPTSPLRHSWVKLWAIIVPSAQPSWRSATIERARRWSDFMPETGPLCARGPVRRR
jgi:hypothetical protein